MYYHADCSIAYLASCADVGGIVISCDSEIKKARQDMEDGGTWEGKRSGGIGKGEEEEMNEEGNHLDGQHVTEFLTMFAYEWYCLTMYTCIVLIINSPAG